MLWSSRTSSTAILNVVGVFLGHAFILAEWVYIPLPNPGRSSRASQVAVLRVRGKLGLGEPGDVRIEPDDVGVTGGAARRAHGWVLGREEEAVPAVVVGREAGHREPSTTTTGQPRRT